MKEASQKNALSALHDWSKWVIGVGFAAGAGCVTILRDAAPGPGRQFRVLAIAAFALAVLTAVVLIHRVAATLERLPLVDEDGEPVSVLEHVVASRLSIGRLAQALLGLMAIGAISLLAWVVFLPPA